MIYRRRRILLTEVERQCRFALLAYEGATGALVKRDSERLWYSLQGLITAASHLNRLIWPTPHASLAWAAELRGAIGIPDESPLNQPAIAAAADVVSALEAWNVLQISEPSRLSSIGPEEFADITAAGCVRCFDPATSTFTLMGNVFELQPLLKSIAELEIKAEQELQHRREVV